MNYKISVIIPVYNAEKYLSRSINSVIEQTIGFENIELILVDDASTDKSLEIITKYIKSYNNIKCIKLEKNTGFPANTRNIGIENANGKYIMFLDNDDYYEKDMCETLFNEINESQFNVVCCNYQMHNNSQIIKSNFDKNAEPIISKPFDNKYILKHINMWDKIYKKEFINKFNIRCPNNTSGEDWYFIMNTYLNCNEEIKFLPSYYGYNYVLREKEDASASHVFTPNNIFLSLEGLKKSIEVIKDKKKDTLIGFIFEPYFTNLYIQFINIKADKKTKIECLKQILEIRNMINCEIKFTEKWNHILDNNLRKKNFNIIILLSNILKIYFKNEFLKKIYRKKVMNSKKKE